MTLGKVRRRVAAGYYNEPEHKSEFLIDVRQCFDAQGYGARKSDLAMRMAYQHGNEHGRVGIMDMAEEILTLLRV